MDSGLGRSCPGLEAGLCTKGGKDSQRLESFIPFQVPGRCVLAEGLQRAVVGLSRGPGQCLLPSTPPSLVVRSSSKAQLCPLCMPYPPGTGRRCESPHHWLLVLWVTEDSTWWGQLGKRGCPGSGSWGIWAPPFRGAGGHGRLLGRPVVRGGRGDRRLRVNLGSCPFRGRLTERDQEANLNAPSPPDLAPHPRFWKQHRK